MKKRILVINKSTLNDAFVKYIKNEGFEVTNFFKESVPPFRKSVVHKLMNVFYRIIKGDRTYYEKTEKKIFNREFIKRSKKLKGTVFDYILFFRADLYPEEMIENLRKLSPTLISIQYDGLSVSKRIFEYMKYLDKVFIFDPNDYRQYKHLGFLPITNCWFPDANKNNEIINYDLFYVGVGLDDRREKILRLNESLGDQFRIKALLTIPHFREEQKVDDISFCHTGLSYAENLSCVRQSKALIDFKIGYHNGLSFRIFEGLYYKKKVITNNKDVKNYDFYHPDNIFITDFQNFSGLNEFLKKPYRTVDDVIVKKYGIENWLKYVLDYGSYNPISLT